jgi:gas vesicle protein
MSQRDGFASGFFTGALIGGMVGGVLGAVIATRRSAKLAMDEAAELTDNATETRQMRVSAGENLEMETARRSLEDKIAQLNATIDDVRKQLGNVNGSVPQTINEGSLSQDG